MNCYIVIISALHFFAVLPTQAQTAIKPARTYHQGEITVVSPNQPGWTVVKTGKSETVFEKRDQGGILNASVRIVPTKAFATEKDRLAGWEDLKSEELSKFKQDHLHFNYTKFKGAMCLLYDAIFPLEQTSSNKYAQYNVRGYLLPLSNTRDSAVQIEFFNYSNTRGFTEDLLSVVEEFFDKVTIPKRQYE